MHQVLLARGPSPALVPCLDRAVQRMQVGGCVTTGGGTGVQAALRLRSAA
jgi:hypothetical protein